MDRLSLRFLGSPEVWYSGRILQFPTRKALALLVYLSVAGGRHSREKLMAFFWPESDAPRGQASLRNTLARLRTALGNAERYLVVEGELLGFDMAADFDLDVSALQMAATESQESTLQAAAGRYRGDFLEGFSLPDAPAFEAWTVWQREYWRQQMSLVWQKLSQQQMEAGNTTEGLATAGRWVAHDPLNEAAHRCLMLWRLTAGNKAAALQAYQACRTILAEEVGAEPSPETEALAERARNLRFTIDDLRFNRQSSIVNRQYQDFPFVGRAEEHRRLVTAYYAAYQGQAQVVVLEGEAGIGKTRLATEFLAWAAARGADVWRGRAFAAGGRLPYQPLLEALRDRLEEENAPEDLLGDLWLAELSRLLPELRERYPDLPAPTEDNTTARTRLPEAVARLGQALAARRPVILFLDDVQWADTASLDMLHYAGRRWAKSHTPILLLLTLRRDFLVEDPALDEWLATLKRELPLTRLLLEPITAEETLRLVEVLAGALRSGGAGEQFGSAALRTNERGAPTLVSFGQWLFGETAGQPLFIAETIKVLMEQGALRWRPGWDGSWAVDFSGLAPWLAERQEKRPAAPLLPPGVRQVILARLKRLTPAAAALLTATAVLGRNCTFERLRQVADLSEREALPALDELLTGRLLLESGQAAHPYTFTHDRIRDVVYSQAGEARRRIYHRRAFAALEAMTAPAAEVAHHAIAADLKVPAFGYSVAAGDAAMVLFAVRDAIAHYEWAQEVGSGEWGVGSGGKAIFDPRQWVHLYTQLGRAYELCGEHGPARVVYQRMLALAQQSGQPEMECAALNHLATLAIHGYEFATAETLLKQAVVVAEKSGDKAGLAQTEWSLAQLTHHLFDFQTSKRHSARALALARELENQALIAGALNSLAYAHLLSGDLAPGERYMAEARALYAALGNRALEADCLTAMAAMNIWQGQVDNGIAAARAAYAISREIENPWGQIYSSNWLAAGLLDKGLYEEALQAAQEGQRQAQNHDFVPVAAFNLLILGQVYRALRAPEAALAVHQEARNRSQSTHAQPFADMVAAELCADYALMAEWPEAQVYAREALAQRTYAALPLVISPRWLETEALLRGGDGELAREDTRRWGELVGHIPRFRLPHLRSLAVLAEWEGALEQAIEYLATAVALAGEIGLGGEEEQILTVLNRLYRAREKNS